MSSKSNKRLLVGVGLDNEDGEVRVTRGENFRLFGGSHQTHESMQEKCIKLNEKLDERGKRLEDLEGNELLELADECGMKLAQPGRPNR